MRLLFDLHFHSCLSPCGDDAMAPAAIAGFCKLAGLDVAALTDHNTCGNCAPFCRAAEAYGLMGLPGMEDELARYQAAREMLDQCPIPIEQLTEEKVALYQQLAEVNREIRAVRKQLTLCKEIRENAPQMEREIQTVENKTKGVNRDERGRQ